MQLSRFLRSMMKIGTHNGAFHCDEALACAILRSLPDFEGSEVVRTRDPKLLDTCDIVVDVGGVFDHQAKRYLVLLFAAKLLILVTSIPIELTNYFPLGLSVYLSRNHLKPRCQGFLILLPQFSSECALHQTYYKMADYHAKSLE